MPWLNMCTAATPAGSERRRPSTTLAYVNVDASHRGSRSVVHTSICRSVTSRSPFSVAKTSNVACLLHAFPVETYVETLALLFLGDAQADRPVDDFENDKTAGAAHDERRGDGADLDQHVRIGLADLLDVEHSGQYRADDAADAVHAEGVERVVVAERSLHRCCGKEAEHARRDADPERAVDANEA